MTAAIAPSASQPRVLVGCPTYKGKAYCLAAYVAAVKCIDYPNFDVLLVDNSEDDSYAQQIKELGLPVVRCPYLSDPMDRLIASRNILRERAIADYEYFLSLEQDVFVPPDIIWQLLRHGKEYVTTVVLNHGVHDGKEYTYPMVSVSWEEHPGKLRYLKMSEIQSGQLLEIEQAHLACTLISTKLLREVVFRHNHEAFDDAMLCQDLQRKGVKRYCDTTLRIPHRPNGDFSRILRR